MSIWESIFLVSGIYIACGLVAFMFRAVRTVFFAAIPTQFVIRGVAYGRNESPPTHLELRLRLLVMISFGGYLLMWPLLILEGIIQPRLD
jgi:hypothetical protein